MVGLAVMSVARLGIGTFNQNIMREQSIGTMEVLLSTPTPISVLLAGSFVFPMLLTGIDVVLYFGFGLGLFGRGLRLVGVLYSIPLLVLTLASFCAFGIISASLLVLIKRGDPLTAPFTLLTSILSGALFPVSTFPPVVQALARIFPAYYGITGLREALLTSAGWSDILPDLLMLAAFAAVLLPLSVNVFARSLAAARHSGTLANY
jgi:ABC-2 type transport system permease protein